MHKPQERMSYLGGDGHVPDAILLLALSAELNGLEAERVREHLEVCWTCRARFEKYEQTIQDVVDFREELVKPHLPLPSGPRAMFLARLEEVAQDSQRAPRWLRLKAFFESPANSSLFRPAVLGAACVVLMIAAMGRFSGSSSVNLSAEDVLQRAKDAEVARLGAVTHPVEYREVNVRYDGRVTKKTVYRDSVSGKTVDVSSPAAAVPGPDVEARMRDSHFTMQEPLSVPAYIAWRNTLAQKHDDILHPSVGMIMVQTSTTSGPLREVDLTFRDSDFHPMAESFHFEDEKSVEIAEVNYDVLPFAKVQPGIFAPIPAAHPVMTAHIPIGPSAKDLLDAEIKARVVLHVLGADLGEQIEVFTDEDKRQVVVSGLVETGVRKEELLSALQVVPFTQLQLTSIEDAGDEYVAEPSTNRVVIAKGFASPLDSQLTAAFPDPAARAEFVNSTFNQARKALNTAWALRRLSDRYSSDVTLRLSPTAQRELEILIRAQVESLESQLNGLSKSLTPVLSASTQRAEDDSADAADWHWLVDREFSSTERIHSEVAALLSGSIGDNVDRDAIVRDLRSELDRMSMQLPAFSRRVSGKFLTPGQMNAEVR